LLVGTAAVALAMPASAQLAPVGVPKGAARFDIRGEFSSADSRYRGGAYEDYLADFATPALGSAFWPALRSADSLVGLVTGQSAYRLNLGSQSASGQLTIGTGTIGVALGLTRRLTIFTNIPLVTTRVQARLTLDSAGADAGLNPAHPTLGNQADQARAAQFFTDFTTALTTLDSRIAGGVYAGNPQQDALARAISARGAQMLDALTTITAGGASASPFLPTAGSGTGLAVTGAVRGLQDTLANQLGVGGFGSDPVLAAGRLTEAEFYDFVSNPVGPVVGLPLREARLSRLGDMDLGAVYTLVDHWDRPGRLGGERLAVQALLRLPTGLRDSPSNFFDVGTGNGRYEVGVSGTADIGHSHWGARLTGGYLWRLPALRVRRVADPSQPIAWFDRATNLQLDAGDLLSLGARPFFRLAPGLAIHAAADWWRQGADRATYRQAVDSIPGISANELTRNSATSGFSVGGGVSYVGRAVRECQASQHCGWPIEASWTYTRTRSGTGGRVPAFRTTRLEIRWYQRIWR
jgi:hypothetical protein